MLNSLFASRLLFQSECNTSAPQLVLRKPRCVCCRHLSIISSCNELVHTSYVQAK